MLAPAPDPENEKTLAKERRMLTKNINYLTIALENVN